MEPSAATPAAVLELTLPATVEPTGLFDAFERQPFARRTKLAEPRKRARIDDGVAAASPAAEDSPAAASAVPPEDALPDDVRAGLERAAAALRAQGDDDDGGKAAERCRAALGPLRDCTSDARMRAACAVLQPAALPDGALAALVAPFAAPECGARTAAAFVRAFILPLVTELRKPASRAMVGALRALLQEHARVVLEELLLPALWRGAVAVGGDGGDGGAAAAAAQAELLGRLLKELEPQLLHRLVAAFVAGDGGEPGAWSAAQETLLQGALAAKPPLTASDVHAILLQVDANAGAQRTSLKLANVLFTLVRGFGAQLGAPQLGAARRIAESLETVLKKPTLAAIGRLEK